MSADLFFCRKKRGKYETTERTEEYSVFSKERFPTSGNDIAPVISTCSESFFLLIKKEVKKGKS